MFKLFSNSSAIEIKLEPAVETPIAPTLRKMDVGMEEDGRFRTMVSGIVCSVESIKEEAAAYSAKWAQSKRRIISVDSSGNILPIPKSYPLKKSKKRVETFMNGSKPRNRRKRLKK